MATVSSFPGMRTKNLLSVSQGSNAWGGQVRLARFDRIRSAPRVCLTFFTQSQENNEDVWGQFVSITPNSSQVDVRSLDGNMKRAEVRKRRDTEVSETEMTVGSVDRGEDNPLEYKLPPGDDYSFSDCIISSPETKSASKLSERVSPNLKPYRVVDSLLLCLAKCKSLRVYADELIEQTYSINHFIDIDTDLTIAKYK